MRDYEKKRYKDGLTIITKLCSKLNTVEMDCAPEILLECKQYLMALEAELKKDLQREDVSSLLTELDQLVHIVLEDVVSDKCIQQLSDGICRVTKQLEEIPCRKIIVFLPYKASMWDAFDSVYQAARSDQRVNVLVMPIPYRSYDKQSDCWHEHYEGESFPSDIKIIDYKNYTLADMEPDYIFIHNPYDQYNYVTRVHEEFFSTKLVEYTEHLVYIPYDVVLGTKIDENFCKMPGVQNAWRVIVQSEKVRQTYIKWINPEKVLALGSPKIDAVVNYKVNWDALPESWKQKCKNRKVFLYNTHLSSIISEGSLFIKRLQNVWKYFRNHQDITLLWRPHPLSLQTAQAMNPDFLKAYLYMVEQFKLLDNCIYDDTPDLDRAIGLSDAYMGDYSSLVMLYGFTGKPMYLHSWLKKEYIEYDKVYALGGVSDGKNFWIPHMHYNALLKIDANSMKVVECIDIPYEGKNEEVLFERSYLIGRYLLLVPYLADNLVWYDTVHKKFSKVLYNSQTGEKLFCSITTDKYLFLFAYCTANKSLRIDLQTRQIESFEVNYDLLKKYTDVPYDYVWSKGGIWFEGKYWLGLRQSNGIVAISTEGNIEYYSIDVQGIRDIAHDGLNFWIVPMAGAEIICWNEKKGIINRFCCQGIDENVKGVFTGVLCTLDFTWILPSKVNYVLRINKITGEMRKIYISIDTNAIECGGELFSGYQLRENSIYLLPYSYPEIIELDIISLNIKYHPIELEENIRKKEFLLQMQKFDMHTLNDCIYKDTIFSLEEFSNSVMRDTEDLQLHRKQLMDKYATNVDGNSGNMIWHSLMEDDKGIGN